MFGVSYSIFVIRIKEYFNCKSLVYAFLMVSLEGQIAVDTQN